MRLNFAELKNVCQFRYLKVNFAPGLTAIVGKNGGGKSNLMKMVYAAASGDFGRNDGLKTDNVCQLAKPSDSSCITLGLEHAGADIEIIRGLRPSTTKLRLSAPGSQPVIINKAQEASEAITNILGVSSRMLSDYVFVDQWAIFDFLSMMPAERAKAFQRLFRTENAESIWKMLGEHHDKLVIPSPGIDKDAVIRRITENEAKYATLSKEYSEVEIQISASVPGRDRQVVEDWNTKKAAQVHLIELDNKRAEIDNSVGALRRKIDELSAQERTLQGFVTDRRADYNRAQRDLGIWTGYDRIERNRAELVAERRRVESEFLAGSSSPDRPAEYVQPRLATQPITQFWRDFDAAKKRVTVGEHFMSLLTVSDSHCPTCGTPRCAFEQHRVEYERQIADDRKEVARLQTIVDASEAYDKAKRAVTERANYYNQVLCAIDSQLNTLTGMPMPSRPKEELEEEVNQFEATDATFRSVRMELVRLETTCQERTETRNQIVNEMNTLVDTIDKLVVTEFAAATAQNMLDTHNSLVQKTVILGGNLQIVTEALKEDKVLLAQLEDVERRATLERKWGEYVLDMRHVLHRDNLPRAVAQNYLDVMQDEINSLLIRFDSPFTVSTDDTLSFNATFRDGRKIPAARLSGGEKVLLALAFRVAVNDIFAKDLGLLCLDEPTAGLDDGNLACLRIAIERLKELASSRGLQVIMITHEKDLSYLFDNVIEIGRD